MSDQATSTATTAGRVVVCAADFGVRERLCQTIGRLGFTARPASSFEALQQELRGGEFEACVIDDGYSLDAETAARLREAHNHLQCVLLVGTDENDTRETIPAIACDILENTCTEARLQSALTSAVSRARLSAENRRLRARLSQQLSSGLIGLGPAMVALRERVHELADDERPALVKGEPGTEIVAVARAIHATSRRAHRPFAKIDCALLTSENLERELFGTNDSSESSSGRLIWAEGGSLLLENIDQASQRLHARLCEVIANALREPEAGRRDDSHSVRLILSVQDLATRPVDDARFGETLAGMLTATSISVPPLRERSEDLGLLAEATLDQFAAASGRQAKRLSLNALNLLREHHWPENLVELQRILQQASACDSETRITAETIRPWLATGNEPTVEEPEWLSLREMERRLIETTFSRCGGNRERTAKALKIGLRTLSGKLREYGYPPRGGPGSNREQAHDKAA